MVTLTEKRVAGGFTLIELMITISIMVLLFLAAAPLISDWVFSAQTRDARGKLVEAFGTAKAVALRNPDGIPLPGVAAGLRIVTDGSYTTVLACNGSTANAGCAIGGANVQWSATYRASITTMIGGVTGSTATPLSINIDNRGDPTASTAFTLSRGASQNDETGTLY